MYCFNSYTSKSATAPFIPNTSKSTNRITTILKPDNHLMSNIMHCDKMAGWRLFGNHSVQKCPIRTLENNCGKMLFGQYEPATITCHLKWYLVYPPVQVEQGQSERERNFWPSTIFLCLAPGSSGEKSNLNDFFLRFNSPGALKTKALPNLWEGIYYELRQALVTLQSCWDKHSQTYQCQEHNTQLDQPKEWSIGHFKKKR